MKKIQIAILSLLILFSNFLPLRYTYANEIYENNTTLQEGQPLTSSEINSIIHEKNQSEQAKEKSHYNPLSVSISILIVAGVAYIIIKHDNKKNPPA